MKVILSSKNAKLLSDRVTNYSVAIIINLLRTTLCHSKIENKISKICLKVSRKVLSFSILCITDALPKVTVLPNEPPNIKKKNTL